MGTLSADQSRYVTQVAGGAGLDPTVVTAWVACETGWNVTKADHNYLNIGPGYTYPSTDAAAAAAAQLARSMGIGGADGGAQIASIIASPWDAGHYASGCLTSTYHDLGGAAVTTSPGTAENASFLGIPSPGDVLGTIGGALGDVVSPFVNALGKALFTITLQFVFTAGALGLIVLGLTRLTGRKPAAGVMQAAQTAASVAALA